MVFETGVTSDNYETIARKFTPKTEYEFKVGWLTQMYFKSGISTVVAGATAQEWQSVSPNSASH